MHDSISFRRQRPGWFYLSQLLRQEGIDLVAVSRSAGGIQADVADYAAVEQLIKTQRPDYVFHLAANSTTRHDALFENHATISTGTLNILESVKKHSPSAKVFISGSGLQFKNENKPIKETDPFEARDPYSGKPGTIGICRKVLPPAGHTGLRGLFL